jgi:sec-independent protein translocase protein TatA
LEEIDMFGTFGGTETMIIVLLIVLLIFGPTKLPQMGQAMGKAIREFKKAGKELRSDVTLDEAEDKDSKKDK